MESYRSHRASDSVRPGHHVCLSDTLSQLTVLLSEFFICLFESLAHFLVCSLCRSRTLLWSFNSVLENSTFGFFGTVKQTSECHVLVYGEHHVAVSHVAHLKRSRLLIALKLHRWRRPHVRGSPTCGQRRRVPRCC